VTGVVTWPPRDQGHVTKYGVSQQNREHISNDQLCELNRMASVICAKFFIQRVKTAIYWVGGRVTWPPIFRPLPGCEDDDQTARQLHFSNPTFPVESNGFCFQNMNPPSRGSKLQFLWSRAGHVTIQHKQLDTQISQFLARKNVNYKQDA